MFTEPNTRLFITTEKEVPFSDTPYILFIDLTSF